MFFVTKLAMAVNSPIVRKRCIANLKMANDDDDDDPLFMALTQ